jgi:hypothetical protein
VNYGTRSTLLRNVPWHTAEENKKLPNKQCWGRFLQAGQCDGALKDRGINANKSWNESNGLQTQSTPWNKPTCYFWLCNRYRHHSKHWSYWLPLQQPTLTGYLWRRMWSWYRIINTKTCIKRAICSERERAFHSIVFSTTCFDIFSRHHLVVDRQMHKRNWQPSPSHPLNTISIDKIPFPIIIHIMTSSIWQKAYLTTCINISAQAPCRSTMRVY